MRILQKDIKEIKSGTLLITTNRFCKSNGDAVMGRGVALDIQNIVPNISSLLGEALSCSEKLLFTGLLHKTDSLDVGYFMVKPEYGEEKDLVRHMKGRMTGRIPGWAVKADLELIKASAKYLELLIRANTLKLPVYLPFPGVGAGELSKESVLEVIEPILGKTNTILIEKP
jgi:hypothetical protein